MLPGYAELHCRSCFSFLTGASRPEELVAEAQRRGVDTRERREALIGFLDRRSTPLTDKALKALRDACAMFES